MSLLVKGGITSLSELTIDAAPAKAKDIIDLILTTQGDILYRNAVEAARLGGDYGLGYNFLHIQNMGQYVPEWLDIEDLIIYLSGAVNRAVALPFLCIPTPTIALAVAEDHSGGGQAVPKALTVPIPTVVDAAELSWLLLEDCEAAWDEYVQANVTSTADGVTYKIGAASAKMAVADLAAVGRLATHDIGPFNLSPYRYLKAWVRSSVEIISADISILLDDHAQCISPTKDLNIGALTANTWTQVTLDMGDTSGCTAIISIGIDMKNDKGIFDFWIDQVRATKGQ